MEKKKLLFICIGNMCRSPMAEGFARELGGRMVEVYSAGTRPTGVVSEDAIMIMEEKGIDISHQRSGGLSAVPVHEIDIVVAMGDTPARIVMPDNFRGSVRDWEIDDPIGLSLNTFRRVCNEIEEKVRELIDEVRREVASK